MVINVWELFYTFKNISILMLLATLSKIVRFGYTFYTFLQNIKLSDFEDSNRKKTISEFVCTKTASATFLLQLLHIIFCFDIRKYILTV